MELLAETTTTPPDVIKEWDHIDESIGFTTMEYYKITPTWDFTIETVPHPCGMDALTYLALNTKPNISTSDLNELSSLVADLLYDAAPNNPRIKKLADPKTLKAGGSVYVTINDPLGDTTPSVNLRNPR